MLRLNWRWGQLLSLGTIVAGAGCAAMHAENATNECTDVRHGDCQNCDDCETHGIHQLLHHYPQHNKVHKQGRVELWWEAKQACRRYCDSAPCDHSHEFKEGFRVGYADVADGGDGVLPPVPPEKYWSRHYRSPSGQIAAQDWFVGFETGASVARANGYPERAWVAASGEYVLAPPPIEVLPSQMMIPAPCDTPAPHDASAPYESGVPIRPSTPGFSDIQPSRQPTQDSIPYTQQSVPYDVPLRQEAHQPPAATSYQPNVPMTAPPDASQTPLPPPAAPETPFVPGTSYRPGASPVR